MSKFSINNGKGFTMTFENEWTISVQFGFGNYCTNRNNQTLQGNDSVKCDTAEIGIWDKNGEWYDFGDDCVKGYVDADEVAEWISKVSKFKTTREYTYKEPNGNIVKVIEENVRQKKDYI